MQEHRHDGTDKLTDHPEIADMFKAMRDEQNAFVAMHNEGSRVKSAGRTYEVNALGQWCRVGKKRREAK